MRIGLREMKAFSKLLFSSVKDSTFFESCGVADLITTCCEFAGFFYFSLYLIYNFHSYELIFLQWEEGIENVPRHSLGMVEKGFVNETSISLKNHVITTSLILLLI